MLVQAAAMLVSLPALLAAKFRPDALPTTLLDERLAIASSPDTSLLKSRPCVVSGHIVKLVVDRTILYAAGSVSDDELAGWETGRGRWEASHNRRPREALLGHGVPTRADGDGERHGHVARFLEGRGQRCYIGTGVCHALATRYAVGAIEGTAEQRMRVIARVGLSTEGQTGRDCSGRHGRPVGERP